MKKNKDLKKLAQVCCKSCFREGRLNEEKVASIVASFKSLPRSQAIFVISELLKALKKTQNQTTLQIESPVPVASIQTNRIIDRLKKEFLITNTENQINPALLGGFRVRIGDTLLDYSLSNKVSQLKEVLAQRL
jgi:hypothetical protein